MKPSISDEDTLIPLLKNRLIPNWDRLGLEHLAVVAPTLKQFVARSRDSQISASPKKRQGKRTTSKRTRLYNNASAFVATWPEDDLALALHPALGFVLEGLADFHVADYLIHCPRDHFVLFTANVPRGMGERPHLEGAGVESRKCDVLWIFAPPGTNSVTAYICHSAGKKHWTEEYCIIYGQDAINAFKLFVSEMEERSADYAKIAAMSFSVLLRLLLRELQQGNFRRVGKSSVPSAPETMATQIGQAKQYVKSHLDGDLTATKVAREMYMSRSSFIQHFSRETGMTFHEFVTAERMEEARRLLSDGYWSINFVSEFVGLKSSQFRMQFRKKFHISPAEFRAMNINNKMKDKTGDD